MEDEEPPNPARKEEIDNMLAQAWKAEHDGNKAESASLYRQALQALAVFRDHSPNNDFEILNSLSFISFVIISYNFLFYFALRVVC